MHVLNSLEETIPHGDSMFPLNIYQDKHINPTLDLYTHWHEEVEIIYVEQGIFTLVINGQEYIARTGDCFIINSQDLHQAFSYQQSDSQHFAIVFNLSLFNSFEYDACQHKYINPLVNGEILFPVYLNTQTETGSLIKQSLQQILCFYQTKPFGWELGIKSNLFQIFSHLILSKQMIYSEKEHYTIQLNKLNMVKNSLEYIHHHYKNKLMISDIAQMLHISPEYYSRIFKLYTGKTPIEYVNDYRIDQATKLLMLTDQSILDISLDCGFENTSYFIRKFKSKKGMTPKKFRGTHLNLKLSSKNK